MNSYIGWLDHHDDDHRCHDEQVDKICSPQAGAGIRDSRAVGRWVRDEPRERHRALSHDRRGVDEVDEDARKPQPIQSAMPTLPAIIMPTPDSSTRIDDGPPIVCPYRPARGKERREAWRDRATAPARRRGRRAPRPHRSTPRRIARELPSGHYTTLLDMVLLLPSFELYVMYNESVRHVK